MAWELGGGGRNCDSGGKLPAGLFGFLRFQSRVVSPAVVRLGRTTPLPLPLRNHIPFSQAAAPPPPFQSQPLLSHSSSARVGDKNSTYHRFAAGAGAPALTRAGVACGRNLVRAAGRGWPFKGVGGAAFHSQLSLPSSHPIQVRERRVLARAGGGGWEWGGSVGSGLCPDTCLPRRPGPASVWREGGSPAPPPRTSPMYQRAAETW